MADEKSQERTEQATPKRRQEARERGQVARSRELSTMAGLVGAAGALLVMGERLTQGLVDLVRNGLSLERTTVMDPEQMLEMLASAAIDALLTLFPLFLIVTVVAILSPMALSGWSFSVKALSFKWEKMDPIKGMGRIFSLRGLLELGKALAKFLIVLAVAVAILWNGEATYKALGVMPVSVALTEAAKAISWSFLALSAAMIVIALVDVPFQVWDHARQLRMTRKEVKDEYKETDGSPEIKRRVREVQAELARRRMMEKVPDADVVITNPTHYAVALKYEQTKMSAPIVVAKGKDLVALQIRNIALSKQVPILSAPPLARALYHSTKLDQQIPTGLFLAVAQVLAYAYQLKRRPYRKPGTDHRIDDLPIPEDLRYDG